MEPLDPKAELMRACEQADWVQVSLNCMHGGRPCFHLADDGDFCLRHETWAGHDVSHRFTTLSAAISQALVDARRLALEEAVQICEEKSISLYGNSSAMGYRIGAEHCEAGIRALIDGKAGGT